MLRARLFENRITPIGITNYHDIRSVFGIRERNRRQHIYLIGKTGSGKSTLIHNMAASDIREGAGVGLIDPHGDLAGQVLDSLPKERIQDVVYLDPADRDFPVGFNPLYGVHPDHRHLVASGLIGVFKKLWPEFWGPRLEHVFRNTLLALLEVQGSTLLDVPRLLTEPEFRERTVNALYSQPVRDFWQKEFEQYPARLKAEATAPILNKIGQLVTMPSLRNIVGQTRSAFRFGTLMNEGKIVIASLSKGRIGEDACTLLGAMMVTMVQLAALSRANIPESERSTFYFYVDEFHQFTTQSFADMLSESRKYGLSLVLAHQHLAQLPSGIRAAVLGNTGTLISFCLGAEDARILAPEFAPHLTDADFTCLPNHHIYLKLMINGATSAPFSATTFPAVCHGISCKEEAIAASRKRYARPRRIVESEILLRQAAPTSNPRRQSSLFA